MRRFALCVLVSAALASVGCSSASDSPADDSSTDDDNEVVAGNALKVYVRIAESKIVFDSKVESFGVKGAKALDLPCTTQAFNLTSKPSLYDGWSPDKAASFGEEIEGAKFREYITASCRNAETQVFGWFGKEREYEFTVPEQLLDKDYKPKSLPLILQYGAIGADPTYFSCDGAFKKTLIGETENAKRYDIEATCKKRPAPTKGELGPIDFIKSPGPYAAVASYKPWMLPPVVANKASFDRVREAVLAKVPAGKYSGAMSTLSKLCDLEVKATGDTITIDHTIKSSNRTRHLELKAEDLLGFVEGDVFADPIRASGTPQGTFAAAELRDGKGESVVVRFEKNTSLDAMVVRIDGAEAYCRRLVKQ